MKWANCGPLILASDTYSFAWGQAGQTSSGQVTEPGLRCNSSRPHRFDIASGWPVEFRLARYRPSSHLLATFHAPGRVTGPKVPNHLRRVMEL